MKDFLRFTNNNGTEFFLAWSKIVSIAFVAADAAHQTQPCAIIRIENAGTIEHDFENEEDWLAFKEECVKNMSDERLCLPGDPEKTSALCPFSRESCLGMDCAMWIPFAGSHSDGPIGFCGLIRRH